MPLSVLREMAGTLREVLGGDVEQVFDRLLSALPFGRKSRGERRLVVGIEHQQDVDAVIGFAPLPGIDCVVKQASAIGMRHVFGEGAGEGRESRGAESKAGESFVRECDVERDVATLIEILAGGDERSDILEPGFGLGWIGNGKEYVRGGGLFPIPAE